MFKSKYVGLLIVFHLCVLVDGSACAFINMRFCFTDYLVSVVSICHPREASA